MPSIKVQGREVNINHRVGDILKIERERRRYTLEHVALELNIKRSYLEQLEDNRFGSLPADIYARSYIRRYADFLHLKDDILLKLYQKELSEEKAGTTEQKKEDIITKEKKRSFSFVLTPKIIKIATVSVLFISFIAYLWYQVSDLSSPPELSIVEPALDEQTVKDNSIIVFGKTSPDAALTINGQPIHLTSEGEFKETITLQYGINILRFEVTNRLGKKQKVEKKVLVE